LSWGATIAAFLSGLDTHVSCVALWNASADVSGWKPEFQLVDGYPAVELWGNLIGKQFYAGLSSMDAGALRSSLERASGPFLVVRSENDEVVPPGEAERIVAILAEAGKQARMLVIPGADHAFMSYASEKMVIDRTVEWFRSSFA
jgi:fermentation-respiration switch protein FrsA (DUF1100 family)